MMYAILVQAVQAKLDFFITIKTRKTDLPRTMNIREVDFNQTLGKKVLQTDCYDLMRRKRLLAMISADFITAGE